jgi:glycosyltransferase involved in cell wall biosynthesis
VRIALVSQVFDQVVPPHTNSVGAMTAGLSRALVRGRDPCEVTVYARRAADYGAGESSLSIDGVAHRFIDGSPSDAWMPAAWARLSPLAGALRGGLRPPLSTSSLLGRRYSRGVVKALAADPPDVVHVQQSTQLLAGIRAVLPRTSALVVHAHAEWFAQTSRRALHQRLKNADLVLAVSDYVARRIRELIPEVAARTHTLFNGVDVPEDDGEAARSTWATQKIVFVGGISPHKGVHDLVAALLLLANRFPDTVLQIIGSPGAYPLEEVCPLDDPEAVARLRLHYRSDYAAHLKGLVPPELRDRVQFLNRVEAVAPYLRSAYLFVFPPIWDEGFGLPPVEAMAAGVPVVVTRSGGVAETVLDGVTGLIVDKAAPEKLAAAMASLLADPERRSTMGAAARAHAVRHFAGPVIADQARSLYAEACRKRVDE